MRLLLYNKGTTKPLSGNEVWGYANERGTHITFHARYRTVKGSSPLSGVNFFHSQQPESKWNRLVHNHNNNNGS